MKAQTITILSVSLAGLLTVGVASPGVAAAEVARASASAVTITLAGESQSSGEVVATHDGTRETVTGETAPPIGVLGGQELLSLGVLAQQATASAVQREGRAEACAGIAGQGGSVAQIADSSCLVPGDPMALSIANLDLTTVVAFDEESALAPLNSATDPLIQAAVGPLTQQLSAAVSEQLGNGGLFAGRLGAVEARCGSADGQAQGFATILDGSVSASLGDQSVSLLELPVNPAPNTEVTTNLDAVVTLVIEAIRTDLNSTLDGQLAPVAAALDPIQDEIVDGVLAEVAPQLAPLRDNLLRATLNKQTRPSPDSIQVTAIDLEVLPAAREQLGSPLAGVQLATVTCGPTDRLAIVNEPQQGLPDFPTAIPSGEPTAPSDPSEPAVLLALALVAATAWVGYRGLARRP